MPPITSCVLAEWTRNCVMLTEIYIEALLIDDALAGQVWAA